MVPEGVVASTETRRGVVAHCVLAAGVTEFNVTTGNVGPPSNSSAPKSGAVEVEGVPTLPVVTLNSVTPAASTQCATTPRLVSVDATTPSGTITVVNLVYAFNGTPQAPIAMTNTAGTTWEATIPVATPANATVTWSVAAFNV